MKRTTTHRTATAFVVGAIALLAPLAGCAGTETTTTKPSMSATTMAAAPAESSSDPVAVVTAHAVMDKMGGADAWAETRFISFRFFGSRRHVWDRETGDIRVEGTDREAGEPYVVLMNLRTGEGRVWVGGEAVDDQERLAEMREGARRAWINDFYWLIMPYKLLDPGVTLRDLGAGTMEDGRSAKVLEVTFDGVGVTPDNKYHVYVADESGLVEQWDFYTTRDAAEPRFKIPWHDWERHGGILLSGNRGGNRRLTEITVHENLPRHVFTDFGPVDL